MDVRPFPTTAPRACTGCGVKLKLGELTACTLCTVGHDFLSAALAYQRANPRRQRPTRRWAR